MTNALKANTYLHRFISLLTLCIVWAINIHAANSLSDSLMNQLDTVISNRPRYLAEKEVRLQERYDELRNATDDYKKFDALTHLYEEYHSFNTDSAYSVTLRQNALANRVGDIVLIDNARLNRANVLASTGMYHETLELLDSVNFSDLPDYLYPFYYHIKRTVYGYLEDYAAFEPEKSHYHELTNAYRDSIMSVHIPSILSHAITKADYLNVNGRPAEAVEVLNAFMAENELSEHDKAICAWTLSESYGRLGDKQKQKEQLLISSISDLKSAVREYISLRQLAIMLYEEGELEKAYELMSIAVDDASKSNSRQRIIEINDYYPSINGIYIDKIKEQKSNLERTVIIITVLAILLLVLILFIVKQMRNISRARKEIENAYMQLNEAAKQIKDKNEKLVKANSDIAEYSELKEVYISKYMEQCLIYIEKLDEFRRKARKLVDAGKVDELKKIVKSDFFIQEELRLFYKQFDQTFLNLFPTFVEDFNSLLAMDENYSTKKDGTLNTELRIFALIRLGISDSNDIARFLQLSLSTIYNYRVKVRNKAKDDRQQLEDELMKIGRKG